MMVKIRYTDLPAGLHVRATTHGRRTVIYLLPGLTPAQRRAALIRVRSISRMGHGPRLPAISMAVAIGADRARTTARYGAAAMRGHPVLLLPPLILMVSSAIVFALTSFVTLTVHGRPPAAAPGTSLVVPGASPSRHDVSPDGPGGPPVQPGHAPGLSAGTGDHGAEPSTRAAPTPTGPTPTISASPPPTSPSPPPTSSASPSPDPPPSSPTSSPSPSPSGACVTLGPLGLCLHL